MKTSKLVIGILAIAFSTTFLLLFCIALMFNDITLNEDFFKYIFCSIAGIIVGIYLVASADNEKENKKASTYVQHQYTEEERKIYFRNADYKAKPITEYQMDERTKLITYYDRMPFSYQKKLSDYADTLYRRYENEEYLKK